LQGCTIRKLSPQIRAAKETYDSTLRGHPVTFVAFRQSPWHHYGVLGLEQTQVAVRTPYLDNDLVKTVYKAPGPVAINEEGRLRLISRGEPALANLRTDRGIGGLNSVFTRAGLEFSFKAEYAMTTACHSGLLLRWTTLDDLPRATLRALWLGRHKIFILSVVSRRVSNPLWHAVVIGILSLE